MAFSPDGKTQLRETGVIADPREQHIERLKAQVGALKKRIAAHEQQKAELAAFRVQAISRLAAQHEEVTQPRAALTSGNVVRLLPSGRGQP